jgi:RNA polymerase sigma-70 factor (ECF subfamily)
MWCRPRRPVRSFQPAATRRIIAQGHDWDWAAAHAICVRVSRRVLGSAPEAEDAAQEAALRAWKNRAACRGAWRPWVATIAYREAARLAAAGAPLPLEEGPEPALPADDGALDRVDVRRALARLAPRDRALVFVRYWRDLTQDQLARLLDMPEGTAKVRLHRARAELRRELSDR